MKNKYPALKRWAITRAVPASLTAALLAMAVSGTASCANKEARDIWLVIPGSAQPDTSLLGAQLAMGLVQRIEPEIRIGLAMDLGKGEVLRIGPVPVHEARKALEHTAAALRRPGLPVEQGSLTAMLAGLSGVVVILAPEHFATPTPDEVNRLSRYDVRVYLIAPRLPGTEAIVQATDGKIFAPEDDGGLALATARAVAAALARDSGVIRTTPGPHRFSVANGAAAVLAIPIDSDWDLIDSTTGKPVANRTIWDIAGSRLVLVEDPGDHILLGARPASVQSVGLAKYHRSLTMQTPVVEVAVILGALVVIVVVLAVFRRGVRGAKPRKDGAKSLLLVNTGDGKTNELPVMANRPLLMGAASAAHNGDADFFPLVVEGREGRAVLQWDFQGGTLFFTPYVAVKLNNEVVSVPRRVFSNDQVEIGQATITVLDMPGTGATVH
ncbi:MAG: hypothetical protein HYY29_04415 [Chloroflexi bacterium]|nr:hypothetical protein [Chloroflexota bacterium]